MWLRAAAGQRGGPESPCSEITHEGEQKIPKCVIPRRISFFNPSLSPFCAALFLPAVVSVAAADGELPGRRGAEAGQAAALRCQTHSPLSAPGAP